MANFKHFVRPALLTWLTLCTLMNPLVSASEQFGHAGVYPWNNAMVDMEEFHQLETRVETVMESMMEELTSHSSGDPLKISPSCVKDTAHFPIQGKAFNTRDDLLCSTLLYSTLL